MHTQKIGTRERDFLTMVLFDKNEISSSRFYDEWTWNPTTEQCEKKRSIIQRYEIWFNTSGELVAAYLSNRWNDFSLPYKDITNTLDCNNVMAHKIDEDFNEKHRDRQYENLIVGLDKQINLLLSIPEVLKARAYNIKQSVGTELIGTDLDHAEQLLNMQGTVPSAIYRAAGIISAIALEKHLKLLTDAYNENLPEDRKKISYDGNDGIIEMANKLKEKGIIEPREIATFNQLNITRQNCAHTPGGNIKEPTEHEVRFLINQTRFYIREIRI